MGRFNDWYRPGKCPLHQSKRLSSDKLLSWINGAGAAFSSIEWRGRLFGPQSVPPCGALRAPKKPTPPPAPKITRAGMPTLRSAAASNYAVETWWNTKAIEPRVRACSGCRECVARMTAAAFVAELLVGFLAGVVALLVFAARHPKKPQRNDDGGLKHRQPIHRTSIDLR
jgi:hypothetical protein